MVSPTNVARVSSPWESRGTSKPGHFTFLVFCFILFSPSLRAATLRTLDGKTYDGEIKLDASGQILVTNSAGAKQKFELDDVLSATFGGATVAPAAAPLPASAPQTPVHTENGQLPAPWKAFDIGNLAAKGYARFTNEGQNYSIKSAGGAIGSDADALCFVAQPAPGDFELTARLLPLSDPKHVTEGLMLRAGPNPGDTFAALLYINGDLRFCKRDRTDGATDNGTVGAVRSALPIYVRLTRRDDKVTASWSRDGSTWERVSSADLPMRPAGAIAGVAVCGKANQLLGGHFTHLRFLASAPTGDAAQTASASFAGSTTNLPKPLKEGLLLRTGTLLAGARIDQADDVSLHFVKGDRNGTLALASVARVIFRELTPDTAANIPAKGAGVLLREGDFIEGDFKGIRDGKVQLSSVLFGLARFAPRDKAAALILNALENPNARMVVTTRDGSVYFATSVTPDKDRLLVKDALAGEFAVNRWDVAQIAAGPDRLQSLADLKPTAHTGDLRTDSTGVAASPDIAGVPCGRCLTLPAGATATWNLDAAYRTLSFACGLPKGVLPTVPVRFIVLADGHQIFRSPPRTSHDPPLAASVSVKGVKTLTLTIESTAQVALDTPCVWADPALVR